MGFLGAAWVRAKGSQTPQMSCRWKALLEFPTCQQDPWRGEGGGVGSVWGSRCEG